jgi:hypothetical protein
MVQVIDTEGHADGKAVSAVQIKKLADFMRAWRDGVNGVAIMINGQADRFSQGIQDLVRWAYHTFDTPQVLGHMCLVFTRCYDAVTQPNRERKTTEYREHVRNLLSEVSCVRNIPVIPVFFVDSLDRNSQQTTENMTKFHNWLVNRPALPTSVVKAVSLREKTEEEIHRRIHVPGDWSYEGPEENRLRFANFRDDARDKITPFNGDPVRYGEWHTINEWREPAGQQTITKENEERHFLTYSFEGPKENQQRFAHFADRIREIKTSYDGGTPKIGEWRRVREWKEPAGRQIIERETEDRHLLHYSYEGPEENRTRIAHYQERYRERMTPFEGPQGPYGNWQIVREWTEPAGRQIIERETENRHFMHYSYEGPPDDQRRYAHYEERFRERTTPFEGSHSGYGTWRARRTWYEPAGHRTARFVRISCGEEEKIVKHRRRWKIGSRYTRFHIDRHNWVEQYTRTEEFDGTVQVSDVKRVDETSAVGPWRKESGWTEGYRRTYR